MLFYDYNPFQNMPSAWKRETSPILSFYLLTPLCYVKAHFGHRTHVLMPTWAQPENNLRKRKSLQWTEVSSWALLKGRLAYL